MKRGFNLIPEKSIKNSIVGSNERYRKVLDLVTSTPILSLAGNIAGKKTFPVDKKLQKKYSVPAHWIYLSAPASEIIPQFMNKIREQEDFYGYIEKISSA